MSLIYAVNFGKSPGNDRGMKTSTQKEKDSLSFEIWIFRNTMYNGQPDCACDSVSTMLIYLQQSI